MLVLTADIFSLTWSMQRDACKAYKRSINKIAHNIGARPLGFLHLLLKKILSLYKWQAQLTLVANMVDCVKNALDL